MGYSLACQVRMIEGLSYMDKAVLCQLALATQKDSTSVHIRLDSLSQYVSCAERTVRYALRRLENLGYLIPVGEKGGRGHVLKYEITVAPPPVEEVPVKPPEIIPPTNGHKPATPPQYHDPYTPAPLTDEQIAARHEKMAAAQARIAAKRREEQPARVRTGRTERERARMVQGESPLDGSSGGDETPGSME